MYLNTILKICGDCSIFRKLKPIKTVTKTDVQSNISSLDSNEIETGSLE